MGADSAPVDFPESQANAGPASADVLPEAPPSPSGANGPQAATAIDPKDQEALGPGTNANPPRNKRKRAYSDAQMQIIQKCYQVEKMGYRAIAKKYQEIGLAESRVSMVGAGGAIKPWDWGGRPADKIKVGN